MELSTAEELPEFATVAQTLELIPALTHGGIRYMLFHDQNFRIKCSRRIGKKLYIMPREVRKFILSDGK